ncbi:hypothetical protein RYZ27_08365 [Hyphomonas sp. FCG-A18]|uniref:hypothetical protein n=1 Tax=Hyphomonas sp. FCG-A18 TaxID=3080019 RepID=UPI002B2F56BB|nr:hypothetical protein RYZ27_08365 [Hyphomonas sp. FCG-A18]
MREKMNWQHAGIIGFEAGLIYLVFNLSGMDDALPKWQSGLLFILASSVIFYVTIKILETTNKA